MRIDLIETKEILDLEQEIGYELEAKERPINSSSRAGLHKFYVFFKDGDVKHGGCLIGMSGNGNTIDEALQDYASQISNTAMVFGAYTDKRKEVAIPKLIHTKLLNK